MNEKFMDKYFIASTELRPKDTIHQHRQYKILYLLAGIVL